MKLWIAPAVVALTLVSQWAHGHEGNPRPKTAADPTHAEQMPFGIVGDPKRVSRTLAITMTDAMRFSPATLEIEQGETLKFIVKNGGKLMHEMVIGTLEELQKHAELMRKFPGMEHDEPHMAHVDPGASEELVWHFNRAGEFHFGCLIPGHFEAGMIGKIVVRAR